MQALEKIGVLEKDEEKGGRRITQSGQRDLGKSQSHVIVVFRRMGAKIIRAFRSCMILFGEGYSSKAHSPRFLMNKTVLTSEQTELRRPQWRPRKKKMTSRFVRIVVIWEWSFGHT
jgi:hypothetical protein